MCISVDYCLVPRGEMEAFIRPAIGFMHEAYPGHASADCTGIISAAHFGPIEVVQGGRVVARLPHRRA